MAKTGLGDKQSVKKMSRVEKICTFYCDIGENDPICVFNKKCNTETTCPYFKEAKRRYEGDEHGKIVEKYIGGSI